jgi:hypothetical protein
MTTLRDGAVGLCLDRSPAAEVRGSPSTDPRPAADTAPHSDRDPSCGRKRASGSVASPGGARMASALASA